MNITPLPYFLLLGSWAAFAVAESPAETDTKTVDPLIEVAHTIERRCLEAYPPEILTRMTGGASEIPEAVQADPKQQQQFLNQELDRDKGLFYPIELEVMIPALQRTLEPGDRFLDLGSGDGRVLFFANRLGAHATGIEYDPDMVKISHKVTDALGDLIDRERLDIIQDDFFKHSWSGYDLIFYFDMSSFEQDRVRDKLRRELSPGALLMVGHPQAPFPGLEQVEDIGPMRLYRRADARP